MKVVVNISVECEGEQQVQRLGEAVATLESAFDHLGGRVSGGVSRESVLGTRPDTLIVDDPDKEDESRRLVERKTYFHHPESECVFFLEKGDTYPEDPSVEAISKKSYDELKAEYDKPTSPNKAASGGLDADDTSTPKEPTQDDVREALTAFAKSKGPAVAKAVVKEFGASKISELDPADYPKLIKKLQESH